MKKTIAIILAIVMMTAMAVPAFAAVVTVEDSQTYGTNVTYGTGMTYTITVPESIALTAKDQGVSGTVSVSNAIIASGKSVKVTISSTQYNNGWVLKNGETATASYTITKDGAALASGDTVLTVEADATKAGGNSGEQALVFTATTEPAITGNYTDSITFTASVS